MIKKILHIISDKQKKQALLLLVLMLIGMALETLGVGLVVPAVMLMMQDNLASKYPMIEKFFLALGQTDKSSRAIVFMFFLVTIYFIKNAYIAFLVWQQNKYAFSVQASLSARLFKAYIQQPYTFYMTVNTAELHRNIMYEVGLFTGGVNNALLALTEILVMIGVGGLLLMLQPVGAFIIVLILGGAALVFFSLTKKHILRWGVLRQVHDGKKSKFLQEALTGVKEVKLLGRELEFFERFHQHNLMTSKLNARQSTFIQLPRLWIEFLMILALGILIFVMMFRGLDATTIIPTLGLFAAAAFRLMPSLNRILAAIQGLKFILPVIDKLDEELNIQANNLTKEHIPNLNFSNQIQLENITFQYPASSLMALNEINIKIGKGESVGLIGASGSGKSTLMDIVLGLLSPMTGTVSVDGVNIQSNLRAWQNKIGYVPQSIFLTDDSILQNIAFGIPSDEVRQDLVDKAIMAAQLDTFVKSLPDGIHTIVGERGIKLSGGQRQRIGIARALYHEPEVLVLDEATSALDTATEQEVMQSINQLKSNKTILIIAHRLSTVMQCDRLYKLEGGVIVAEGKPEAIVMTE